jgi:hypothetical protein
VIKGKKYPACLKCMINSYITLVGKHEAKRWFGKTTRSLENISQISVLVQIWGCVQSPHSGNFGLGHARSD